MQKGTTLFVINDRPTRLDDHAAAVYRLTEQLYRDFLLLYRLPKLFPLKKQQVIHFSYAPRADYGRGGLFFPSSSLLEQAVPYRFTYGKETSLKPVLQNEANLDNARTLRGIIQQLSS